MYEASISGIQADELRMEVSAHNTANLNTEEARAQRVVQQEAPRSSGVQTQIITSDGAPELITETIEQIYTPSSLRANVTAVRSQDEMQQMALDLFA